jgi:hypothetical protein
VAIEALDSPGVGDRRVQRRPYCSGLALVNPSGKPVTFRLYRPLYDENGNAHRGTLTLEPTTGQILLTTPSTAP